MLNISIEEVIVRLCNSLLTRVNGMMEGCVSLLLLLCIWRHFLSDGAKRAAAHVFVLKCLIFCNWKKWKFKTYRILQTSVKTVDLPLKLLELLFFHDFLLFLR